MQVQSLGYRTLAVGNAGEALAMVDQREKIDLLFTDVVLSGSIDGLQQARQAWSQRPLLKVLYTPGYVATAIAPLGRCVADVLLLAKSCRKARWRK